MQLGRGKPRRGRDDRDDGAVRVDCATASSHISHTTPIRGQACRGISQIWFSVEAASFWARSPLKNYLSRLAPPPFKRQPGDRLFTTCSRKTPAVSLVFGIYEHPEALSRYSTRSDLQQRQSRFPSLALAAVMDSAEPDQTPFATVSAQTSKIQRVCALWARSTRLRRGSSLR